MSIGLPGRFYYTVAITGCDGGEWSGRADAPLDSTRHPGLVGDRPNLTLADGVVTLECTETEFSFRRNPHYREGGLPSPMTRFRIGSAIEKVIAAGDVLTLCRFATGNLGARLVRAAEPILTLGAYPGRTLGQIDIEEDPRAAEGRMYGIAYLLDDPQVRFIWLHPSDPNLESLITGIRESREARLLIAIAGDGREQRRLLNHRISRSGVGAATRSCHYVDVDERFSSPEQWIAYVRGLPKQRPTYLWIRFTIGGRSMLVREAEYCYVEPWHLFVQAVYRWGLPGELSQFAVARAHPRLSEEVIVSSAKAIASGAIEIT